MCNRTSGHNWATTQPLSAIPVALILDLSGLRMTTHKNSIALELAITTLNRDGLIMKLTKLHLHSLSLHQPLPSPVRGSLGLYSQEYRFRMCHFLELGGGESAKCCLTKGELVNYLHGALNPGIRFVQEIKKKLRGLRNTCYLFISTGLVEGKNRIKDDGLFNSEERRAV